MDALSIKGLTKKFGAFTAIDGLSLSVSAGDVYGFLGPNGAGKTTTLRILLGLAKSTSGTAEIFGADIGKSRDYLRDVGYLPDVPAFYNWMNAREYLQFAGELLGMKKKAIVERSDSLLRVVGLDTKKRIGGYSRGMKQRLGIAQALINEPKIVFLDEPTSALDPIGRKEVLDTIESIKTMSTVFFSTHILSDVERVCNKAAIIDRGRLIVCDEIANLKRIYGGTVIELKISGDADLFAKECSKCNWLAGMQRDKNVFKLNVQDTAAAQKEIPQIVAMAGLGLARMERLQPALEDIFVKLVNSNGTENPT